MKKILLLDNTPSELREFVRDAGEPAYRARQLLDWLYKKRAVSYEELTNLPKPWRKRLQESTCLTPFVSYSAQTSVDGTKKYLFGLHDGAHIESVRIPMKDHFTLCISTQVGCTLDCTFCLTGRQGFSRNLSSGEILGQILAVQRELSAEERISNIVLMGMGEPLLNYDHTVKAIRMMLSEEGLNFSNRKITISTAGIVPGIRRLGQEDFIINLAVSLNAPTDEVRSQLMPVNTAYPLQQLLHACRSYPLPERRRITFEYILINNVNDAREHAVNLVKLLRGIRCKINLIPYNFTSEIPYTPSPEERIIEFQEILLHHNYSTFIRTSKGADISAACGQLRGKRYQSATK
jgi:23S rRNA (adenine2503-C2)-methyltransferase